MCAVVDDANAKPMTEDEAHAMLDDVLAKIAKGLELHRSGQIAVLLRAAHMIAWKGPCEEETEDDWAYLAVPLGLLCHASVCNQFECEDRDMTVHEAARGAGGEAN